MTRLSAVFQGCNVFDKNLLELPGMRAALGALAAFSLLLSALAVGQSIGLSQALANMWAGESVSAQALPFAVFLSCLAMRRILAFGRDGFLERLSSRCGETLLTRLLAVVFSPDASLSRQIGTAATAQAASEGIDQVQRYIRVIPSKLSDMVFVSLALAIALFAIDWVSAIIVLAAFPVTIMFMVVLGRQARTRAQRQFATSTHLANHFIDTLRGIDELIALGAVERAARAVYEKSEELRVATVRLLSISTLSSALLDLVNVFAIAACSMMLAFRLMDGTIALPTALCALILAPEALAPLRSYASEFHASLDGKTALATVLDIIEQHGDGGLKPAIGCASAQEPTCPLQLPDWNGSSSLTAEGVGYRYEGSSECALEGITLDIRGFERIAIVGSSGSGKTTLTDILAGFRDTCAGHVFIDGCEVESLSLEAWRRQIAYIPQNPYLFRATLRENITFYAPNATDGEIDRVIHDTGLDRLLEDLPRGIDTMLGDGGRGLSGGQAQRIALARALLANRPILIFDEPTAHLDIETEMELKRHMLAAMNGKLVVLATHRLHWLRDMDRIVVLENGHVAGYGPFGQLVNENRALSRFITAETPGDVA